MSRKVRLTKLDEFLNKGSAIGCCGSGCYGDSDGDVVVGQFVMVQLPYTPFKTYKNVWAKGVLVGFFSETSKTSMYTVNIRSRWEIIVRGREKIQTLRTMASKLVFDRDLKESFTL